jgi:hypothetical protein
MSAQHSRITRGRMSRALAGVALGLFVCTSAGCNNAAQGGVSGGALGALAGLGIGSLSGNAGKGAAIGAIGGAIGGAILGDQNRRNQNDY